MNNKQYFLLMGMIIIIFVAGLFLGLQVKKDTDCEPIRTKANTIINECYEELMKRTICETKFVCVECGVEKCVNIKE